MKQVKLKIIAGSLKGKTLVSYSEETRESASMVKGAVFNMLYHIEGSVLDLFAGSGAYGFEAISRGATKLYLNDHHPLAIKSLKTNESTLNTGAIITSYDYKDAIKYYQKNQIQFDFIFLDPPYAMEIKPIIETVVSVLQSNGKIIVEVEKSQNLPEIEGLNLSKDRTHGIKRIGIYEK